MKEFVFTLLVALVSSILLTWPKYEDPGIKIRTKWKK